VVNIRYSWSPARKDLVVGPRTQRRRFVEMPDAFPQLVTRSAPDCVNSVASCYHAGNVRGMPVTLLPACQIDVLRYSHLASPYATLFSP
jgi:hypothetical protein